MKFNFDKTIFCALVTILIISVTTIISCKKDAKEEKNYLPTSENKLTTDLSQLDDFKAFVANLSTLKELALASAYPNSFMHKKDPLNSDFFTQLSRIQKDDLKSIKEVVNSQFANGDDIYALINKNFLLSRKIVSTFPELSKISQDKKTNIIANAIQLVISNQDQTIGDKRVATNLVSDPCITSCQNQYYISAGVCALLVETGFGALICMAGAWAGLSACKSGCPTV
ncbi:MAG: hypothetical protein J0H85_00080 [Sediminibacterium magnilacihabitans]|jgi:hypothetical protein|nr:hypothetical protein [Sediminibacterium magnilacihabitans]PQV61407.1 hypothetical protein CLV53_10214 [Sediminibacterium magnilacihabitans]